MNFIVITIIIIIVIIIIIIRKYLNQIYVNVKIKVIRYFKQKYCISKEKYLFNVITV